MVYSWHEDSPLGEELERLERLIGHAHGEGESVIVAGKQVERECGAVVCEYLMHHYRWSMLKALEFITSRLTASARARSLLLPLQEQPTVHIPLTRLKLIEHYLLTLKQNITYSWAPVRDEDHIDEDAGERLQDRYRQIRRQERVIANTFLNSLLPYRSSYLSVLHQTPLH